MANNRATKSGFAAEAQRKVSKLPIHIYTLYRHPEWYILLFLNDNLIVFDSAVNADESPTHGRYDFVIYYYYYIYIYYIGTCSQPLLLRFSPRSRAPVRFPRVHYRKRITVSTVQFMSCVCVCNCRLSDAVVSRGLFLSDVRTPFATFA